MLDRLFMEDYDACVDEIVASCVKDLGKEIEKLKGTTTTDHHFGYAMSIRNKYIHKNSAFHDADGVSSEVIKRLIFIAEGGFEAAKYTTKKELLALLEGLDEDAQIMLKVGIFSKTDSYASDQTIKISETVGPHGNKIIELNCEKEI